VRILGLLFAYNEADCIGNAVRALLRCTDCVHLIDHGSTDDTAAIARAKGAVVTPKSRELIPPTDAAGRQSTALWEYLAQHIRGQGHRFDWVVFNSADDLLREPDGRLATREGICHEHDKGIEVIRPLIRVFWPRKPKPVDYLREMLDYTVNTRGHSPRAWRVDRTPEALPLGGHIQDPATGPKVHEFYGQWPEGTRVSNNEWLIDQYPFRSREQATRKVKYERAWITPLGQRRYSQFINNVDAIFKRRGTGRMDTTLEMP